MSLTKGLLVCGVLAAALYILTDISAAALFYPGYSYLDQQVSELSAIDAPSRPYWMLMTYPYGLLTAAFAVGVWRHAAGARSLRIAAALIMLLAINGVAWGLLAPMHMRGTEFDSSDAMHLGFAVSAIVLIVGFITSGALALGRGFRLYSAATVIAMLAAGAVVGTQVAAIAAGEPTRWMGLLERISVYGPTLWMAVFAIALLHGESGPTTQQARWV
jgi:hypothetical protein